MSGVNIRRHLHPVLALLLPLMLLRALLPPGYMPVASDEGLRIVMCSAGLSTQADAPAGTDHSQTGDDGSCLFAHAATFAPPATATCCIALGRPPSFHVPAAPQLPLSTGPPRLTAARGPPHYS